MYGQGVTQPLEPAGGKWIRAPMRLRWPCGPLTEVLLGGGITMFPRY